MLSVRCPAANVLDCAVISELLPRAAELERKRREQVSKDENAPSSAGGDQSTVIGFRGFRDGFAYVVLAGTQDEPVVVAHGRCAFPKNQEWPRCLSWLRRELLEVVGRHSPGRSALKAIERNAKRKAPDRLQVEAVIHEVLWTEFGVLCPGLVKVQIRKRIPDFKDAARYLDRVLDDTEVLSQLKNPRFQDAALAAFAALGGD